MKNSKNNDISFQAASPDGLLSCVRSSLPDIPAGKLKSFLEHRQISVDGAVTTKFDFPVAAGQTVRISRQPSDSYGCPLEILYEDDYLLAVNKPAGLLSVATDTEKEKTAYRLLADSGSGSVFVVHRLDRDTSGVLLFAKNERLKLALQEDWNERALRRDTFDLLIVDWELPGVSGPDIIRWVREHVSRQLPILFITHRQQERDIVELGNGLVELLGGGGANAGIEARHDVEDLLLAREIREAPILEFLVGQLEGRRPAADGGQPGEGVRGLSADGERLGFEFAHAVS